MSFMPNVGTQVVLTDGRHAWILSFRPQHGEDDRVIFEDAHEEPVDVMTGIRAIVGEEMPQVVLAALCQEMQKRR